MNGVVWNSSLKRKKPMKRQWMKGKRITTEKTKPKKAKTAKKLPQFSDKKKKELAAYRPIQREFLRAHDVCEICIARGLDPRPATEVHHKRGRLGRLLCDTRFFVASCYYCRLWPHDNKEEARTAGVLAERNDWEVYPPLLEE